MKKMHTCFYLLLLVGFVHIDRAEMESTLNLPITKNDSEISADESKKALMKAIEQNNEDKVSHILAHPKAKNFDEYDLLEALTLAAENNYVNIANILIQAGANIKDRYCYALGDAAKKGYTDMVKILLPVQGCKKHTYTGQSPLRGLTDTDHYNYKCDLALISAAKKGHLDVMKELISAGASVDQPGYFGQTALLEAVKNGHVGAVKTLIKAKVNVNAANRDGQTALNVAVHLRNVALIRELLKAPRIDVSWQIESIQRDYEDHLKKSDQFKRLFENDEDYKIKLTIFELFKPFMKL